MLALGAHDHGYSVRGAMITDLPIDVEKAGVVMVVKERAQHSRVLERTTPLLDGRGNHCHWVLLLKSDGERRHGEVSIHTVGQGLGS